jgi:energy-coupling factor transporter ATP-binding protein EcfA2
MVTPPLRCHLLIGPPASGKSTLAAVLAQRTGAIVLSTDAIRAELHGDAAVQGPWSKIEALFHQRLKDAVAAGLPVILDGTHSQRPWRLAILQVLKLPAPPRPGLLLDRGKHLLFQQGEVPRGRSDGTDPAMARHQEGYGVERAGAKPWFDGGHQWSGRLKSLIS